MQCRISPTFFLPEILTRGLSLTVGDGVGVYRDLTRQPGIEVGAYTSHLDLFQWPVLGVDRNPLHLIQRRIRPVNHPVDQLLPSNMSD